MGEPDARSRGWRRPEGGLRPELLKGSPGVLIQAISAVVLAAFFLASTVLFLNEGSAPRSSSRCWAPSFGGARRDRARRLLRPRTLHRLPALRVRQRGRRRYRRLAPPLASSDDQPGRRPDVPLVPTTPVGPWNSSGSPSFSAWDATLTPARHPISASSPATPNPLMRHTLAPVSWRSLYSLTPTQERRKSSFTGR